MAIRPPAEAHSVNVENSLAIEMSEKKNIKLMKHSLFELRNHVFATFRGKERNMNSFESARGLMPVI